MPPAPRDTADVQLEHGYTRIAHRLLTAVNLAPWDSESQMKIIGALFRVSYGLQRRDAPVGMAGWRTLTGLSDASIKRAVDTLSKNGVLVMVKEEDAKRCQPKVWRIQKDFTSWKRFRVSPHDVEAAEKLATQGIRTPPGTPVTPGSETYPGSAATPGSATTPAPGSAATPGPGTPVTPGHAPEALSPNGSRPPKDSRDRKDRDSTPLASPLEAGGHEGESPGIEPPGPEQRARDREIILRVWHLGQETVSIDGKRVGMGLEMRIRDELAATYGAETLAMALPHVRAVEEFPPDQPISLRLPEQRPEVMRRMVGHALKLEQPSPGWRGGDPAPVGELAAALVGGIQPSPDVRDPPPRDPDAQRARNRRQLDSLRAAAAKKP